MPTPIKEHHKFTDERDQLKTGVRSVLGNIRDTMRNKYSLSYEGLVRMIWTEEQFNLVNEMRGYLGAAAFNAAPVTVTSVVTLEHPALPPRPVDLKPIFRIDSPVSAIPRPFPKEWTQGDNWTLPADGELGETFRSIAYEAMDYHCIKATLYTLARVCETYEQALYLFPHFRMAMKRGGLYSQSQIEVRKAPQRLPRIDERMRRMIKHAHTLMAMHVLLNTFDETTYQNPPRDGDGCVVTLCGNTRFDIDTGTGLNWEYRLNNDDDPEDL